MTRGWCCRPKDHLLLLWLPHHLNYENYNSLVAPHILCRERKKKEAMFLVSSSLLIPHLPFLFFYHLIRFPSLSWNHDMENLHLEKLQKLINFRIQFIHVNCLSSINSFGPNNWIQTQLLKEIHGKTWIGLVKNSIWSLTCSEWYM
jgi:hypothetical protein